MDVSSTKKCQSSDTPEIAACCSVSHTADATTASMSVDAPAPDTVPDAREEAVTSPVRKKKKKTSYKTMIAGILEGGTSSRDVEKEKEKLREVTGGGHFSKIDKI